LIVVLRDRRIVEQWSHEELMEANGEYTELVRSQTAPRGNQQEFM
jgi:ABC-type multidrug transport system fused ATPase/permease subunit